MQSTLKRRVGGPRAIRGVSASQGKPSLGKSLRLFFFERLRHWSVGVFIFLRSRTGDGCVLWVKDRTGRLAPGSGCKKTFGKESQQHGAEQRVALSQKHQAQTEHRIHLPRAAPGDFSPLPLRPESGNVRLTGDLNRQQHDELQGWTSSSSAQKERLSPALGARKPGWEAASKR